MAPLLRYAAYTPAVCFFAAAVPALAARGSWRVRAALTACALVLPIPALLIEQPRLLRGPAIASEHPAAISLLTWNVKSYSWGQQRIIEEVLDHDPDVLALVEGTFRARRPDKIARALWPGYHWAVGNRLSVASKFPIIEARELQQHRNEFTIFRAVIDAPGGQFAVLVVDLDPPWRRDDERCFDEIYAHLAAEPLPAIITGDFNTPRGSRRLRRATAPWRDAFREAGAHRWLASWQTDGPRLWQLDHCFASSEVGVLSAELPMTGASDHRPMLLRVAVE